MRTNKVAEKYLWGDVEWEKRTKAIANLIPSGASVIDLGGGLGHLYKHLSNCEYTSIDIEEWTSNTVKADFNKGEYPTIVGQETNQYIVAQGVIEYIKEADTFLKNIKKYGDILILSYRRYIPGEWRMDRKPFTFKDIEEALEVGGWEIQMEKTLTKDTNGPIEKIMICRNKNDKSSWRCGKCDGAKVTEHSRHCKKRYDK